MFRAIMQTNLFSAAKFKVLATALLLGATVSQSVFAQHRHFRGGPRIGVYIGAPLLAYSFYRPYYSPYYYQPYYYPPAYYPPVVVAPAAPPTYVEQSQFSQPQYSQQQYEAPMQQAPQTQPEPAQSGSQSSNMWYYCNDARAYYPYVKSCPAGWQQVTPQPQN